MDESSAMTEEATFVFDQICFEVKINDTEFFKKYPLKILQNLAVNIVLTDYF